MKNTIGCRCVISDGEGQVAFLVFFFGVEGMGRRGNSTAKELVQYRS